ncbi:MAG: hypothetical protein WBV22_06090, partial [Anaerolineaceae bacterium]
MMMNKGIGIIDADLLDNGTRHPNLALMKISGYYKDFGEKVTLLENYNDISTYEKVFISKVFSYTKIPVDISRIKNVIHGGTGFFPDGNGPLLELAIEHHMPDYHLYDEYINLKKQNGWKRKDFFDYQNFSIGFTTRGCFRKCDFCVNKIFDKVIRHSPVSEFYDPGRFGIYLWDDNFLGYSGWEDILNDLERTNKPFQFRQGLDIRLLTAKKAKKLLALKYYGDFIFAFDHIDDTPIIENKLELWRSFTNKTTKLFVLCAYESQDLNDIKNTFARIHTLMKYG